MALCYHRSRAPAAACSLEEIPLWRSIVALLAAACVHRLRLCDGSGGVCHGTCGAAR
jgi:hypothetical protein